MAEAYIVDALRTPTGKRKGGLAQIHAADLGAHVLRELVRASPWITGRSSSAKAETSHAPSSPPACAVAGFVPPAARTVVIRVSIVPRNWRRSSDA